MSVDPLGIPAGDETGVGGPVPVLADIVRPRFQAGRR